MENNKITIEKTITSIEKAIYNKLAKNGVLTASNGVIPFEALKYQDAKFCYCATGESMVNFNGVLVQKFECKVILNGCVKSIQDDDILDGIIRYIDNRN